MDSGKGIAGHPRGLLQRRAALIACVTALTVMVVLGALGWRDDRAWPDYPLVLGVLAGLGLGVAVAFVWDRYTGRLTTISDVETATGLPVLGMIPPLAVEGRNPVAVTSSQPVEGVEAYRHLADGLAVRLPMSVARCVLITSPTRKAGRTTIAVNLAALFASDGMNVALVSADTRGGRADQLLRLQPEPGLMDVLDGSSSLDAALQASGVERLNVLAAGAPSGRMAASYSLDDLALLLDQLTKRVDVVVLEAPPVLGGVETVLLAEEVDLVLVVVDVRRGRRSDASTAMSYLGHVEDRLVGCVANDPGPQRSRRRSDALAPAPIADRSVSAGLVAAGAGVGSQLRRRVGAVGIAAGSAGRVASAGRARLAAAVRLSALRRHRWVGIIATAVAVALVISTGWWLSYEDRPGEGRDTAPAATRQAAVTAALAECRSNWAAQTAPLDAAAESLDQWQVHIAAMNQLVAGRITLDQANAFWERTRLQAAQKIHRFHDADDTYTAVQYSCRAPAFARNADTNLPTLSACRRDIAQRDDTIQAARVAINTWHHHVMDMNMLRAGDMSPARALRLWDKYWRQGVAELDDYRAQLRQTNNQKC
jgi:Mrp family chromosome partitioning ATPase